jgi:cobalt/nickel transport system ATP-binding protein
MTSEEIVRLSNLSYSYPDGHIALRDINLVITHGERVALIGPNGAGKSTLLLHLNGILHQRGTVTILGRKFTPHNSKLVKFQVGLVFQNPDDQLFSPTVFEDVAFGPLNMGWNAERVRQAVSQALAAVGLDGFEKRPPYHLSLGEKKRAAIATVLSMEPQLLVLDEPSSNLDPRTRGGLLRLLQTLPVTQIIATHDLDLVKTLCPRTIILDRGQIRADGPTTDIFQNLTLLKNSGLTAD